MLAIINADLRTCGPRGDLRHATVLVADGKIVAVGENLAIPADAARIDARGLCVTPGFIDAHTHMGMGWQELAGEADANESTSVVNAHLRAIDAINLNDVAFDDALEGGVTTLMILPGKLMIGAQNISPVAGQAVVMKARGDVRGREVLRDPAGMKLALGADVAAFLNGRNIGPNSRMGITALLRGVLDEARRYRVRQPQPGAQDARLSALAQVLARALPVHIHAHQADDILTALRLADEYDLDLVIHHATEGHLVAETLAAHNAPCVVGPTSVARETSPELRNATGRTPAILAAAGVKIALMTDHPTDPIQFLPLVAGEAVREGLPHDEALRAITINPAQILGVADRVGSLEVGKDADLVIHDGDPLEAMTRIRLVLADGQVVVNRLDVQAGSNS